MNKLNHVSSDYKVKDAPAEKIKEYFLNFLENYNELTTDEGDEPQYFGQQQPPSSSLFSDLKSAEGPEPTRPSGLASLNSSQNTNIRPSSLSLLSSDASGYNGSGKGSYYTKQIIGMKHDGLNTLFVDFSHLYSFNDVLANAIVENYYRFEPYLRKALLIFVQIHIPDYVLINNGRQQREFWVSFYGLSLTNKLRELTTTKIGQLLSITGTVTRSSEVRPELYEGAFQCNQCRTIAKNIPQQFKYTEPPVCQNPLCSNRTDWALLVDQSHFIDWQRVRIQENSHEIPPGSMPRSMDVILRNDLVERAKAGDKCTFVGCLIVIPDISQLALPNGKIEAKLQHGRTNNGFSGGGVTGLKMLGVRELGYKLAFMACMVSPSGSSKDKHQVFEADDVGTDGASSTQFFTFEEKEEILRIKNTSNLYQSLIESIAPAIFGHQDIKAGLLLMLFGGLHKVTHEGISLRGDINICIVGDPGTAKSQFLKYITGFLPRSVYTSGKASTAAGLTASVVKDEETGEFTIEAGALMLADNGICAIDEFDKMDLVDQVAIHEAMEQQTISIAKAGIHATLNARTSILAAANPIHGRYDKKKSLRQNIAMSAPIMSRFDLFFVILDECNETSDYNIARHVLALHRLKDEAIEPIFSDDQIQRYIKYARTINPHIDSESSELLIEKYVQLRQNDMNSFNSSYRITVRQLESMIRLSEALARLHLDTVVRAKYVREAYRLLKNSVVRVETENIYLLDEDSDKKPLVDSLEESPSNGKEKQSAALSTNSLTIKYENYTRISHILIYYLRKKQNSSEEPGIRKSELIEWYLEQIEEEIQSEQELYAKQREVKAIIERLVQKDFVLIELRDGSDEGSDDPLLFVHPNYQL